jgi:hypothetical protein
MAQSRETSDPSGTHEVKYMPYEYDNNDEPVIENLTRTTKTLNERKSTKNGKGQQKPVTELRR